MACTLATVGFLDIIPTTIATIKDAQLIIDVILTKTITNQSYVRSARLNCNFNWAFLLFLDSNSFLPSASEFKMKMWIGTKHPPQMSTNNVIPIQ